ncbi:MAG TPA: hypothetical protein VKX40_09645 [Aequorivita sp.]|nr:hypothetical protein [Aequorivita sp.]
MGSSPIGTASNQWDEKFMLSGVEVSPIGTASNQWDGKFMLSGVEVSPIGTANKIEI